MENNPTNLIELRVHSLTAHKKPLFRSSVFGRLKEKKYLLMLVPADKQTDTIKLSILIGKHEAMQIAIEIEGMTPSMPLLQDLFKSATDAFGFKLDSVSIDRVDENYIFHCTITYSKGDRKVELHARASDAITMAMKYGAPIYTVPELLAGKD